MNPTAPRRLPLAVFLLVLPALVSWFVWFRTPVDRPSDPIPARGPAAPVAPSSAADSPRRALDAALVLGDPRQRSGEFGRLLRDWVGEDPDAALAYVRRLPPGPEYTQGLLLALAAVGRSDPARALILARELVVTREQRAFYHELFAALAAQDPVTAAARLALVPAGDSRERALRALADGWAAADWPAALAWAQKLETTDRAPAMEAVIAPLVAAEPARAIELARQTLTGAAFDRTVAAALESLAPADPRAAAGQVGLLPPGDAQTRVVLAVARALATQDPAAALAWTATLPADGLRRLALHHTLDFWARQDPAAAGRQVDRMTPGPAQTAAAEHLARLWTRTSPEAAVTWAALLADDTARRAALVNIASAWAQRDPVAAVRWAAGGPVDSPAALSGALSYWVQLEPGAARDFVRLNLAGEIQTRAAAHIAPALAQRDPLAAVAWARTLPGAAAREAALAAAFARWMDNAPAEARAWLATADLTPEFKARLDGKPSGR